MILPVVKYGDPILETVSADILEIDDTIRELAANMVETMRENEGIGLAANQVGVLKQLAVIDPSFGENDEDIIALINPEVIEKSEDCETENEGCLSFPEVRLDVERPARITVKSINLDGEEVTHKVESMLARVFLHEIDHLNGIVFINYLKGLSKQMTLTKIKSMKKRGDWD